MATIENFANNTLIIPMDVAYQNVGDGMFTAYGLVYRLLKNNIPVKWSIQPGKAFDGTDFTATAKDFQTSAVVPSHNYTGGPFIIDSAFFNDAKTIIIAWQLQHPNTKVHIATAPFSAPIAATLFRPPRIAIEAVNSGIVVNYLNKAFIPDSTGSLWTNNSPDILDETEIADGALFGFDTSACRRIAYDIFLSPHTGTGVWDDPGLKIELNDYLAQGGYLHAMCASIPSIENTAGPFLTQSGIPTTDTNKDSNFRVNIPDFPSAQAVTVTGKTQGLPGGSFQTVYHNTPGLIWNSQTQVIASFLDGTKQYDFMVAGPYKNGAGAGKVIYEGGHNYDPKAPYTSQMENMYYRFCLDSVFFSVTKPLMFLEFTPDTLLQGIPNTITFRIVNTGASPANNTSFKVVLQPGLIYQGDATPIAPTQVGQTLTWSSLGDVPAGATAVTFTAKYTPSALGTVKLADFTSGFGDEFNETYNLNHCISATVERFDRAIVTAEKTVDKKFATFGDTLTYTTTLTNTGTLAADNVVFTDPIPMGSTLVPGSIYYTVPPDTTHRTDFTGDLNTGLSIPVSIAPNGGQVVVTFQVTVDELGTPINIVNSNTTDFTFTDGTQTFTGSADSNVVTTVINVGQLGVDKTASRTGATINDIITYTINVTNTGNVIDFGVVLTDIPPTGTTFVPNSVTVDSLPVLGADPSAGIPLGDMALNASHVVTFDVKVTSIPTPPQISNKATATFKYKIDPTSPGFINGTASSNPAITNLVLPQLTLEKSENKAFVQVGDQVTYTVVVTNTGTVDATNVIFTDTAPVGTTFVPNSFALDGNFIAGDPAVGINIGNFTQGQSKTVTFKVDVTSVPSPNPTTNMAHAAGSFTIQPGDTRTFGFDSNILELQVEVAILSLTKSTNKTNVEVNDIVTYTVTINNPGTVDANNVIFKDTNPNGMTFVPGSFTLNGNPFAGDPNVGIDIGTITKNGGVATVTFQEKVNSIPSPNPTPNFASTNAQFLVNPNGPPVSKNFESNTVFVRVGVAELDVTKTVDKAFAQVGETLLYTVTIKNSSTVVANNVIFQDTPPTGTSFVTGSVTVNGTPDTLADPVAGFNIGSIPIGGTATVTFKVKVGNSLPPVNPIQNFAHITATFPIDPNNPVTKPFEGGPATTKIEIARLDIVKSADKSIVEVGDQVTYKIVLNNTGTVPANNVFFTDVPPAGTSFVPGSVTINSIPDLIANPSIGFNIGNIAVNNSATVTFTVDINSIPSPNPTINIAGAEGSFPVNPNNPVQENFESNPFPVQIEQATLQTTKTADKQFAKIGDKVTYSVVINNTGTVDANNVIFVDNPPAGTTFVPNSVTLNGVPIGGNPATPGINIGTIAKKTSATVSFQVEVTSVPDPNPSFNIATIKAKFPVDPTKPPVDKTFTTNEVPLDVVNAQVTAVKSQDKAFVQVGDTVTYTVKVTNTGNVDLTNVVVTDVPPNGTTFVPGTITVNGLPAGGDPASGINVGNLAQGAAATVTFQVKVTSVPVPNPTTNFATGVGSYVLTPGQPPVNLPFETNPIDLNVKVATLNVDKSVDKPFVEVGDTVTFTVAVSNPGTVDANNVVFTDTLPTGLTFVPNTVTVNGIPTAGSPSAGISLGTIIAGGSKTVKFQADVVSIPNPNPAENIAVVNADFPVDPNKPPVHKEIESPPTPVKVEVANVDVTKTVDKAFAEVGDTLTYTVTLHNTGTVAANNVQFKDTPPNGTSFVTSSVIINGVPNGSANPSTGFSVGNIPAGGTTIVIFQAKVDFVPVPNPTENIANIHATFPVDPNNPIGKDFESEPVPTKISIARLDLIKSADKSVVEVGDTVIYTVLVSNTGTVEANNVFFTDTPPTGTTFTPGTVTINGAPDLLANPIIGFNIGNIAAGSAIPVTFAVKVDTIPTPNPTENFAAAEGTFPVNPDNPTTKDFESNKFPVKVEKAELTTEKTTDKTFAEIGETVTYNVKITNTGTVNATGVTFNDTLPAGTTYVPNTLTVNGIPTPGNPTNVTIGTIAKGASVTVSFKVKVDAIPTPNPTKNVALITANFLVDPNKPPVKKEFPTNPVDLNVVKATVDAVKSVDKTGAVVGDTLTYTIKATNTGNVPVEATLYDLVAPGTVFVPNSVTIDGIPVPGDNPNIGIPIGLVNPGQTVTVTFKATITELPVPPVVEDKATVEFTYTVNPNEPPRTKDQDSNKVTTNIEKVSLELTKTADKETVIKGDILTYTIKVKNTGTLPVNNVIFTDPIPEGTIYVPESFKINGAVVPGANPDEGVNLGTIPAGETVTVTFSVKYVFLPCPPVIKNIAFAEFNFRIVSSGTVQTGTAESNPTETHGAQTNFKQFSVEENLCIPPQKPDAEDILSTLVEAEITEFRVVETMAGTSEEGQTLTGYKLIIEGLLHQKSEYIAAEPTQTIHTAEFKVPFSTFIVLPEGFDPESTVKVFAYIEDVYVKQLSKRCLFKNVTLRVEAQIIC